jgi:hypothetical protein
MLIKSGTSWTKYRFEQHKQSLGTFKSLNVADNITLGGTVDGHDIDSELNTLNGRVNQAVNTTSSPTFANSTIGGHNVKTRIDNTVSHIASTANPHSVTRDQLGLGATDNVSFANINPPVDNTDNSLPSIGKGGFTYGASTEGGNIILPVGGTYIVLTMQGNGNTPYTLSGRFSGGTTLINPESSGSYSYMKVFVWRIA